MTRGCTTPSGTPTITSISPSWGATAGNTIVTIDGIDLGSATSVTFGVPPPQ